MIVVESTATTFVVPRICTEEDEAQDVRDETPKNPAIAVIIYRRILQISLISSLFIELKFIEIRFLLGVT